MFACYFTLLLYLLIMILIESDYLIISPAMDISFRTMNALHILQISIHNEHFHYSFNLLACLLACFSPPIFCKPA